MSGLRAVARREFVQRVRSRWFVVATVAGPLLLVGLLALPVYLQQRDQESSMRLALLDETGRLAPRLEPKLVEAGYDVVVEPWSEEAVERLEASLGDGAYGALLVLDRDTPSSGVATLRTTSRPSPLRTVLLRSAVSRSVMEASLDGVDVDALLSGGELTVELLTEESTGADASGFVSGFIGAMLLYMAIILWATAVLRATLEEKRDRIAEIIVSSMRPWHLMLGKMIGVGGVGLLQLSVWALSLGLAAALALPAALSAWPVEVLERVAEGLPGPGPLALFVGFFLGGYFIYSGLYAAIGAMCNSDEEVQQVQIPVILLYMAPVLFLEPTISDPGGPLATSLSLVPFFTPVLMWPRVAVGAAPVWQIALSYLLMAVTVIGVAWLAGRIYKTGMLMAGKRPTLPELWRWMREA